MKKIHTKLNVQADEELEEKVKAELKIPDPSIEKAKAVLKSEEETLNEDTKRDDRGTGDRDDK
tara:strand:- start:1035 stop:1223 length:189 start_codon:yes stop_codon:yes gene_type:complete